MSEPRRDQREQEISIKQREGELFRREAEAAPATAAKPFAEYLRETPASPLPSWVKAALWAAGVVVALLFAVALWRLQSRPQPRKARRARPGAAANFERPSWFSLPIPIARPLPETVAVADADASRPTPTNPEKS